MIMIGRRQENVVEDFDFILKKAEVRVKLPKSKSTARIILMEKNNGHYKKSVQQKPFGSPNSTPHPNTRLTLLLQPPLNWSELD